MTQFGVATLGSGTLGNPLSLPASFCPSYRLSAAGIDDLVLSHANGWRIESLDVASPVMASVVAPRSGANGTIDRTLFHRDRAVSLHLFLVPEDGKVRRTMLDGLKRFLRPDLRPHLIFSDDETDLSERRILLRCDQWSDPVTPANMREVLVQWRAPDGFVESAVEKLATAFASGSGAEVGRTYNLTFNRSYPASPVLGSVQAVNDGTVDAWPLIRIYGACTEPNIENQTTGRKLELNALTLAAGEYLEVDTRNKTIRLNGLATSSRYDKVDFAVSAPGLDLRLVPGVNQFRFYPATSTNSRAEITWRDAYL